MAYSKILAKSDTSISIKPIDRLTPGLVGTGVIFAALGLGEAVYRFLFLEFEGATDRLPIEMLFGLVFAWIATKVVGQIYQRHRQTSAKLKLIQDRNRKIRQAVEAIAPIPHLTNQQAIRVIREEVDRIDWVLSDIVA